MPLPDQAPPSWHALHYLPLDAQAILDIGCGAGEALHRAYELGIPELFGIDINPTAIALARQRLHEVKNAHLLQGSADQIPVGDESVDVTICCEVLEHVPQELRPSVIREAHRTLRDGAWLIISVPHAGLFAWLDPANIRLRFPRLFRVMERSIGGKGREAGYDRQKHGIVWHHHFSVEEILRLLQPYFEISHLRWRGCLLVPLCAWLQFPFYRRKALDHPVLTLINWIERWEMSMRLGETLAYDVLVVARKK